MNQTFINSTTELITTGLFFSSIDVTIDTFSVTSKVTVTTKPAGESNGDLLQRIDCMFAQFAYFPITTFGVLGNLLSLWVWSAETTYNSTVLMLMVMAVWDCMYCLFFLMYYILTFAGVVVPNYNRVGTIVILLSQVCSINTTLMSSITRLVAMFRPTTFNLILSKPRVIALCVAIFVWGLLLTSLEASWNICLMAKANCAEIYRIVNIYRENYVFDYLAYCLPSILLLVCNIVTVWKVRQQRAASMTKNSSSSTNQKRGDNTRRLSLTMAMISITSLLTYPVAVSTRLALNPGQELNDLCDLKCFYIVSYTMSILTLTNSSVNVIYYCVISSRFMELLRLRMIRLCRCVRCVRV